MCVYSSRPAEKEEEIGQVWKMPPGNSGQWSWEQPSTCTLASALVTLVFQGGAEERRGVNEVSNPILRLHPERKHQERAGHSAGARREMCNGAGPAGSTQIAQRKQPGASSVPRESLHPEWDRLPGSSNPSHTPPNTHTYWHPRG